jgi:type VI secretion system protein ImpH
MLEEPLLRYAGLISQRPHSATALQGALRDRFQISIVIEQFIGSWYSLSEFDRSYLEQESERNQLGVGAFLGDRVWDQQAKFRIKIGPVNAARFCSFLPDGNEAEELREITRLFVGTSMAFEMQLVLRAPDVPRTQLGVENAGASQLAWNSWLKTTEFTADARDATFTYLT